MTGKLRVIVTGATGMVGEGVLYVCLQHPDVASVLVINRKTIGIKHPKLQEVIHTDFYNLSSIEPQLAGYNACFFCLGISSVGVSKDQYYKITYELTIHVARTLSRLNSAMQFCYVSGAGTDSSEKGRVSWARVKGKTENDLALLPFAATWAFRPGFIKPIPGLTRTHNFYKYINWLFPIGRAIAPSAFCTMQELADAMIHVVQRGYRQSVIEGKDIIALAKK
jgi:hypothetical protein